MSESATLWLFGTVILVLLAVIGTLFRMLWAHVTECREFRATVAAMAADVTALKHEVGDHERGLRGSMHSLRAQLSPLVVWAQREMEKQR